MATTTEWATWLGVLEHEILAARGRRAAALWRDDVAGAAQENRIMDMGLEGWLRIHDRIQTERIARRSKMKA